VSRTPKDTSGDTSPEDKKAPDDDVTFDMAFLVSSMGGVRGLAESTIPGVVFATVFAVAGGALAPALWAACITAVVILVVALVQRRSIQQTLAGFIGILFSAAIVLFTGRARDFFLFGIWRNAIWLAAHVISGAIRWPLIGLILGPFTGEGLAWRKDRARLRAYLWCTLVWIGVFGLRLAVQLPLFRGDEVVALGWVGVFLGVPLFLLACAANYLILARVPLAVAPADAEPAGDTGPDPDNDRDGGPDDDPDAGDTAVDSARHDRRDDPRGVDGPAGLDVSGD
jgi:hypothetical protein